MSDTKSYINEFKSISNEQEKDKLLYSFLQDTESSLDNLHQNLG